MKTFSFKFVVSGDDTVFSCTYIKPTLIGREPEFRKIFNKNKGKLVCVVRSAYHPDFEMSRDGDVRHISVWLRGASSHRDNETTRFSTKIFNEVIGDILLCFYEFDKKYSGEDGEEDVFHDDTIIFNKDVFVINENNLKNMIVLLRGI